MSAQLRVIDGGNWKGEEARIEAIALCDETANDAEAIYAEVERMAEQIKRRSMRLMHRATLTRIELQSLGGDAA